MIVSHETDLSLAVLHLQFHHVVLGHEFDKFSDVVNFHIEIRCWECSVRCWGMGIRGSSALAFPASNLSPPHTLGFTYIHFLLIIPTAARNPSI